MTIRVRSWPWVATNKAILCWTMMKMTTFQQLRVPSLRFKPLKLTRSLELLDSPNSLGVAWVRVSGCIVPKGRPLTISLLISTISWITWHLQLLTSKILRSKLRETSRSLSKVRYRINPSSLLQSLLAATSKFPMSEAPKAVPLHPWPRMSELSLSSFRTRKWWWKRTRSFRLRDVPRKVVRASWTRSLSRSSKIA